MSGTKSKAYSPELTAAQAALAQSMGIPTQHAEKKIGQQSLALFSKCSERGVEFKGDYQQQQVEFKLQDKAILRDVEKQDHKQAKQHNDSMALMDIEIESGYDDDKRVLLGCKSADEIRSDKRDKDDAKEQRGLVAELKKQVEELKKQRAELSTEIATEIDSGTSKGNGQSVGPVVPS